MADRSLPPGPKRRARMLEDGLNLTLADFTAAERAELDDHAATAMAALRRDPEPP